MWRQTCGAIPRPTRKLDETYTVEPAQDGERFVELRRVGENPAIIIAWHAPALSHPDSAALEVLGGIMAGGGRGGTGRLYKALVDNKKALSVRMDYEELHDPGFVMVSARLSKDQSLEEARKTILDTVAGVVTEPPTKEEVEREKTRILQGMEQRMANSQHGGAGVVGNDRERRLAPVLPELRPDQERHAGRRGAGGEALFQGFQPHRGRIYSDGRAGPHGSAGRRPDLEAVFKDYKTGMTVSQGEAFDPAPANIEKHLTRAKLPDGLKLAMLPKTTRGGTVSAVARRSISATRKALAGKNAVGSMTGALLMRGTKNRTRQQIQDEMVKLNARINVSGGVSGAVASIQTTAENLIPALRLAAEMLREPSFPESEFESGEEAADRRDREPQDRARRAGAAGAGSRAESVSEERCALCGHDRRAYRGFEQSHAR